MTDTRLQTNNSLPTEMKTYPRAFSHIGISVPDLEAAVNFYTEVLGWYLIMEPTDVVEDDSPIGEMCLVLIGDISNCSYVHR